MLPSEEKRLNGEEMKTVVGGAAPRRPGNMNWENFAKLWLSYTDTLEVIPERYVELNIAATARSYINVERIVYNLLATEPIDGPVRVIFYDEHCYV